MYRKFGCAVRYENGFIVRGEEAGEAIDDGEPFACHPIAHSVALPQIDAAPLEHTVREIEALSIAPLSIERLVVSEGIAEQQFGARRWRETTRRIHLSLACRTIRALIDLGDFDLEELRAIAEALPNAGDERGTPPRVVLAPSVAAALLPTLVGLAPPNVRLWQSAGGFDGNGEPIEQRQLAEPPWPNVYRPSYRSRPVRAPFHLRATCDVTSIEDELPRAIALLAPPDGLVLRVLCVDRREVFPTSIRVARIDAIATAARWYPYGAGSFGSAMML
ncbi:MAG TPA: hypothetical protein VGK04_06900 [Thermoanaerobaculia bacterium]